ncbi:class III signal peptide-containing protein [Methanothermococcus okinawensis]|uniref:Class III signal peptide-containing protein n=1 Tax=Methanothermococcus okinawensis (strain DSM 14208 / JCM 11175 / IH1) TaxID=647113 RepID=F8AMW8_METOI|nr:class III signal peptide-containing protein [Methanothermococcus okinawensis]AEH06091.1 hypothetical protein Metok_0095 [Methanothermococcus okinawensis IH1]
MKLLSKRAQLSLEFSMLILSIIVMSTFSIYYFLHNTFNEKERTMDKIDIGAKTAVSLVNSNYNGTYTRYPLIYLGMKYDNSKTNVTIYIINRSPVNSYTNNFIINYIINTQHINNSKYNISISYQ